jgi:hypothetical protein
MRVEGLGNVPEVTVDPPAMPESCDVPGISRGRRAQRDLGEVGHGKGPAFVPASGWNATLGNRGDRRSLKRSPTPAPGHGHCQTYSCPAPWQVEACSWSGGHAVPDWAGEEIWRFFSGSP